MVQPESKEILSPKPTMHTTHNAHVFSLRTLITESPLLAACARKRTHGPESGQTKTAPELSHTVLCYSDGYLFEFKRSWPARCVRFSAERLATTPYCSRTRANCYLPNTSMPPKAASRISAGNTVCSEQSVRNSLSPQSLPSIRTIGQALFFA